MIHRRRQDGHKNSAADALSSDIREKLREIDKQGGTAFSGSRLPPSDIGKCLLLRASTGDRPFPIPLPASPIVCAMSSFTGRTARILCPQEPSVL